MAQDEGRPCSFVWKRMGPRLMSDMSVCMGVAPFEGPQPYQTQPVLGTPDTGQFGASGGLFLVSCQSPLSKGCQYPLEMLHIASDIGLKTRMSLMYSTAQLQTYPLLFGKRRLPCGSQKVSG